MSNSNEIQVTCYKATAIEEGETYGYVTDSGSMSSTITITKVVDGVASAIRSHWGESWIMSFDAKTGEGIRDFVGTRLVNLI